MLVLLQPWDSNRRNGVWKGKSLRLNCLEGMTKVSVGRHRDGNSGKIWGGWGGWIWESSLGQKSGSKLSEWLTSPRKKVWGVRRESSWVQNSEGQHSPTDMPAETKTLENVVAGDVSFSFYSSFGQLLGEFYILRKYISFQACSHQKYKTHRDL